MRFIEQSILQKRLDITRAKADAAALKKKQDLVSIRADDAKLPDVQKSLRQPFADIGANIASLQSWTQAPAGNAQTGQPVIQGDSPLASRVETLTTIVRKLQATALISNAAVTTANVSASLTSGSQKSGTEGGSDTIEIRPSQRQKEEETSRKDDRISKDAEYRGRNRNDDYICTFSDNVTQKRRGLAVGTDKTQGVSNSKGKRKGPRNRCSARQKIDAGHFEPKSIATLSKKGKRRKSSRSRRGVTAISRITYEEWKTLSVEKLLERRILSMSLKQLELRCTSNTVHYVLNEEDSKDQLLNQLGPATSYSGF